MYTHSVYSNQAVMQLLEITISTCGHVCLLTKFLLFSLLTFLTKLMFDFLVHTPFTLPLRSQENVEGKMVSHSTYNM